jgi:hypothetical protein
LVGIVVEVEKGEKEGVCAGEGEGGEGRKRKRERVYVCTV